MSKYKLIKHKIGYPNQCITEDGHTLFIDDILRKLERLEYLEKLYEGEKE